MQKMSPVVHFEMPYEDKKRMADFYTEAFGWQAQHLGPEMGDYVVVMTSEGDENGRPKNPGTINGGFFQKNPDMGPQHPSLVIAVDEINETIKNIKGAGGTISGEPMDIPGVGKYVSFTDTEGNVLSILQPLPDM
jgi:uncharacterized protein